jgi:hypothetical protein
VIVKAGGRRITIEESPYEDDYGTWHEDLQKITIKSGISPRLHLETIVHELLHEEFDRLGFDKYLENNTEELIITALAPNLLDLLTDNPKLRERLWG